MGSYTFTWEHTADEVLVTGTFDNWQKTVQLDRIDDIFQKEVHLPKEHVQYKFVVDGRWCANESAPKTDDFQGGHNNVLTPDDIKEPVSAFSSSAAPHSTTAALAGAVPKEDVRSTSTESIPGAFPLTPPAETPGTEPRAFNINPIPASEGVGNPIKLAPGEPVPHPSTFTSNTIHNTVKTDAASYEHPDSLPPQLGPVAFTPDTEREAKGGMFGLPSLAGSVIPESSLPKDVSAKTEQDPGVTIQSAAPTSTTAVLAGNVPLEPRVPETVVASQEEAGFSPEAAANPEAVEEKNEVEEELKAKVPVEPATSDNSTTSQIGGAVAAGATAIAGAFAAATYAAKDKAAETIGTNGQATSSSVPEVVSESQKEAHVSPEAAANSEAVVEKSEVEQELKALVPKEPATSDNSTVSQIGAAFAAGATATADAFTAATYAAKDKVAEAIGANDEATPSSVPEIVSESQKEAHVSPEASANTEAVQEKSEVEQELKAKVPEAIGTNDEATPSSVPEIVSESQKEAHVSPEASANTEAVQEKSEAEQELKAKVPEAEAEAESFSPAEIGATATAGAGLFTAAAYAAKDKAAETVGLNGQATTTAADVPDIVAESLQEAHANPEAAANAEAVEEKKEVETELLQAVKKTNEAGEPAPTVTAATSTTAPGLSDEALVDSKPLKSSSEPDALAVVSAAGASPTLPVSSKAPAKPETPKIVDSRDVSPMSKQPTTTNAQTQPVVTTGIESHTVEANTTPESPKRDSTAGSVAGASGSVASGVEDKKKKRRSIFGRIKDKLKN